jgi:membrane fusion protein (multidrug efflux system)
MNFKHKNILFALAASFALASCGNKNSQPQQGPPPAIPVTTAKVELSNPVYYDEYPGNMVALDQITLTPQVSGYITGIYFKDGQHVKKGQYLYSIDAQVYKANVNQAVANLQVQEANLVKAQKDAARYNELAEHDAIAKQQVDYANAALEATKKQVAAAEANVASLQSNVQFANIYSPLTGTIGISQVKKGTAVVAGQTVLNTVSTNDPIAVDFNVDEKEIVRFMQIKQTGDDLKDSTFLLILPDQSAYSVPGKIDFIDRAVDPNTGTIKVRLTFQNKGNLLRSGMSCNVRIRNNNARQQLVIPYKAVTEQLGEFTVFVVGDSSKVEQKRVALGTKIADKVIVKSGLEEGETIVTEGTQNLQDGTKIQAVSANPAQKNLPDTGAKK